MSFGYGVGDFLVVGQLCWRVYKRCKESPGNYAQLSTEVGALQNVLKETEELLSQQELTTAQQARLATCRQGCEEVLRDLNGILEKYQSLGTKSQRTFDRLGFGTQDVNGIRLRLNLNVSMLDAFNNASSHERLENKLNILLAEVRAGKRDGSVISTQTCDTITGNDRETWEALRRELEDIGISPGIIIEKREFIIAWVREAVATGKLEEAVSSDKNDSDISSYGSDDSAEINDLVDNKDKINMEVSFQKLEPCSSKRDRAKRSMPTVRQLETPSLPPVPEEHKPVVVSYASMMLQDRNMQIFKAAVTGDELKLSKLLDGGVDVNVRFQAFRGATPLHLAAECGKKRVVRLLLASKADVHAKNDSNETALHQAARKGRAQIILLLLLGGARIESKALIGFTALHYAAVNGHSGVILLLLENRAHIESKTSGGFTALRCAATNGHTEVLELLLEKGAQIESKASDGWTALHAAVIGKQDKVVQLLLEKGAQIESKTSTGLTVLHCAAVNGSSEVVQLLLEKGAQIESKTPAGFTTLHCAAVSGHSEVVQLLLEKGAQIESKESIGRTALHTAAEEGRSEVVKLLLEKGAQIESKDSEGYTSPYVAAIEKIQRW